MYSVTVWLCKSPSTARSNPINMCQHF